MNLNTHRKLLPRWVGPFTVVHVYSDVAYKLDLPATYKAAHIHPTFHVSLLKPYKSDGVLHPPPPIEIDNALEYEVEDILQVRIKKTNQRKRRDGTLTKGRDHKEYLVKWKGYGYEHCTWEPEAHLTNAPDLVSAFEQHQVLLQQAKEALQRGGKTTPASQLEARGDGDAAAGPSKKKHRAK